MGSTMEMEFENLKAFLGQGLGKKVHVREVMDQHLPMGFLIVFQATDIFFKLVHDRGDYFISVASNTKFRGEKYLEQVIRSKVIKQTFKSAEEVKKIICEIVEEDFKMDEIRAALGIAINAPSKGC